MQSTQMVLRIAEEDLQRRILEACPQITHDVEIMADMIREVVEQARFEKGYATIEFDLYWDPRDNGQCLGKVRIAKKLYQVLGEAAFDVDGRRVLKIRMRPQKR